MEMTKQQTRLLKLAYKNPVTVRIIYKKLHLDYESFYAMTAPIQRYWCFQKAKVYEDSLFSLSLEGIEYVEKTRKGDARYWLTTGIAVAALVKSFLPEILEVWAWLLRLLTPQ